MNEVKSVTLLADLPDLKVYPQSVVKVDGVTYGAARMADGLHFVALGPAAALTQFEGNGSAHAGETLLVGPTNAHNMARLRSLFPWLKASPLGLRTSAGMGDRLGLATPGHVRAIRATAGKVAPIFAQQSIREMTRTGRSPQRVMDDAAWGVFQEGWQEEFGADADHLKTAADIDRCITAGFTFFTIDPGEYVNNAAETMGSADLNASFEVLPWADLEDNSTALRQRYLGKTLVLEGHELIFDEHSLLRAAVKYGGVIAHVTQMDRHLKAVAGAQAWEMEISVDETELPTLHLEHVYIASELRRLGVEWVSLAPRYIGRFEKGVDYIGDLAAFEADFAVHAAIARHFGPYKLSLHSGSDKFGIYPIAARQTNGMVHLKTAGTSWLEALRTVATLDPAWFRELYKFAREHYDLDRATYHVSGQVARAPLPEQTPDAEVSLLLDQFHARQILHVTFGSVLVAKSADGSPLFYDHLMALLRSHPESFSDNIEAHFRRHLMPFADSTQHQTITPSDDNPTMKRIQPGHIAPYGALPAPHFGPELVSLIRTGDVYSLSVVYDEGIPVPEPMVPYTLSPRLRHGDLIDIRPASAAAEVVTMAAHTGTHIDALCHIGEHQDEQGNPNPDGPVYLHSRAGTRVLAQETVTHRGQTYSSIAEMPPIITRAVLVDVAGLKGVKVLSDAYMITPQDIQSTLQTQGIAVRSGTAVLIRTGFYNHLLNANAVYANAQAGIGVEAARYLLGQGMNLVGSDTMGVEAMPPMDHAVHRLLLVHNGVTHLENLYLEELAVKRIYEFLLIVTPLRLNGATGSWVHPIAIT